MNEPEPILALFKTQRGRVINLYLVESFAVPSPLNPKQPYGCYMGSGIFHQLEKEEFEYLMENCSEVFESLKG